MAVVTGQWSGVNRKREEEDRRMARSVQIVLKTESVGKSTPQ